VASTASYGDDDGSAEAELAGDFLRQALAALIDTGRPTKLGINYGTPPSKIGSRHVAEALVRSEGAKRERLSLSRNAVLFAAFAVEAGANYYIAVALPEDLEQLDGLKTVDKLLIAPRLATGGPLFRLGRVPTDGVVAMFKLRNRIVHPKPGKGAAVGSRGLADFTPRSAAEAVVSAARALKVLYAALPAPMTKNLADLIVEYAPSLRKAGREWTDQLPQPPGALVRAVLGERVVAQDQPQ
jgi:hypothetical protein